MAMRSVNCFILITNLFNATKVVKINELKIDRNKF